MSRYRGAYTKERNKERERDTSVCERKEMKYHIPLIDAGIEHLGNLELGEQEHGRL
jgi:hypothetical protein